jgi:hypothetical protein
LDYGCGGQPYRALFEPVVDQYIAADVTIYQDKKVDVPACAERARAIA